MQPVLTIFHMFPDANMDNIEVFGDENGNWEITKWELPDQQPTKEEIEAYWNDNQQAILDANKPVPSEMDTLKANQDLMQKAIDDIILGGAL
jgi:hypothetical protein